MANIKEVGRPQPYLIELPGTLEIGTEFKDDNGHVNNAGYLTYFERERARLFRQQNVDLRRIMKDLNITIVASEINIKYGKEFVPGDTAKVLTRVGIGSRMKLLFDQNMSKEGERGSVHQTTICLFVSLDQETKRPSRVIPIPKIVMDILSAPR